MLCKQHNFIIVCPDSAIMMRLRALQLGTGVMVAGSLLMGVHNSSSTRADISSLGIVRFGRAAISVAVVIADYKLSLWHIDQETELYQQKQAEVDLSIVHPTCC